MPIAGRNKEMESFACRSKKLKLATALSLSVTLLLSGFGCAKDETPPVIHKYEMPDLAVEDEIILLNAYVSDDKEVKEVYIQFDDGSKKHLAKIEEETSTWEINLELAPGNHTFSLIARDNCNNESKIDEELTVYPYDGDSDEIGYRDEIKYGLDPDKPNPNIEYILVKHPENDGNLDENEKALIDLLPMMDEDFIKYVTDNKFTFEDGKISDSELNLLMNPDSQNYIQQLFNQYISDVNKVNPELGRELRKLSDLRNLKVNGIEKLEGLEDVVVLAGNPEYSTAFDSMLGEGIKGKRIVCTPLEATFIIACEKELVGQYDLKNYSLERFMRPVWTEGYFAYREDIWEDVDNGRVNSPNILSEYFRTHYNYRQTPALQTPAQTLKEGGDCKDYSKLGAYWLDKAGYEVYILGAISKHGERHSVMAFKDNEMFYVTANTKYNIGRIWGPYKTLEEAANEAILGFQVSRYWIYTLSNFTGKVPY